MPSTSTSYRFDVGALLSHGGLGDIESADGKLHRFTYQTSNRLHIWGSSFQVLDSEIAETPMLRDESVKGILGLLLREKSNVLMNSPIFSQPAALALALAMVLAVSGCNRGEGVKKWEKTEPIYPPLPYRLCTSHDLEALPAENEKLRQSLDGGQFGAEIYFYIYGPIKPSGVPKVVPETLPTAARLMNVFMKIHSNCRTFYSCEVRDGEEASVSKETSETCSYAQRYVGSYVSEFHTSYYEKDRIASRCDQTDYSGVSEGIETVITKGIESVDTITDQTAKATFRDDLKTLCGHYREVDYCGRNEASIYELCDKNFSVELLL